MAPMTKQNPKSDKDFPEQFYTQVSESIKLIFDLTSRIDERVKMLVERQNELDERLEKILEAQQSLINRISILESKSIDNKDSIQDIAELGGRISVLESHQPPVRKDVDEVEKRVQVLERKSENLDFRSQNQENRWKAIFEFMFKMTFILLGGYILYKFGWQSPPTP